MGIKLWASIALFSLLTACGGGGGPAVAEAPASAPAGAPVVKHEVRPTLLFGNEDSGYAGYALAKLVPGGTLSTLAKEGCAKPAFAVNPATGLVEIHCRIGGAYRLNTETGELTRNLLIAESESEDAAVASDTDGTTYFGRGLHAPFANVGSATNLRVVRADGALLGDYRFPDEAAMRVPAMFNMSKVGGSKVLVAVTLGIGGRDVGIHRFATDTFLSTCERDAGVLTRYEGIAMDGEHVAFAMPRRPNDPESPDVIIVDATSCETLRSIRLPTDAQEASWALARGMVLRGDTLTIVGGTIEEKPGVYGVWQYDLGTGTMTNELRLPAAANAIAESKTLGQFYVTSEDNLLREIDAKTFTVLRTVPGQFHLDVLFFAEE